MSYKAAARRPPGSARAMGRRARAAALLAVAAVAGAGTLVGGSTEAHARHDAVRITCDYELSILVLQLGCMQPSSLRLFVRRAAVARSSRGWMCPPEAQPRRRCRVAHARVAPLRCSHSAQEMQLMQGMPTAASMQQSGWTPAGGSCRVRRWLWTSTASRCVPEGAERDSVCAHHTSASRHVSHASRGCTRVCPRPPPLHPCCPLAMPCRNGRLLRRSIRYTLRGTT